MRTAQTLYENGFITYMRTDSVNLSQQAISAARSLAASRYGKDSVPAKPRLYETKSKGAQEAHEAIRPAGDTFRLPSALAAQLNPAELKLYELIFKRTLASQMNDAIGTTVSVKIQARSRITTDQAEFATSGTVITEPGFLAAYEEGRDEESHHGENPEVPTSTTGTRTRNFPCATSTREKTGSTSLRLQRAIRMRPWLRRWRNAVSDGPRPTPRRFLPLWIANT